MLTAALIGDEEAPYAIVVLLVVVAAAEKKTTHHHNNNNTEAFKAVRWDQWEIPAPKKEYTTTTQAGQAPGQIR